MPITCDYRWCIKKCLQAEDVNAKSKKWRNPPGTAKKCIARYLTKRFHLTYSDAWRAISLKTIFYLLLQKGAFHPRNVQGVHFLLFIADISVITEDMVMRFPLNEGRLQVTKYIDTIIVNNYCTNIEM